MKISVVQENLVKAVATVSRVVGSRASLPILGNILLKADKSSLSLSTTNLEIALTVTIGCKAEQTGTVCVPAKLLLETLQSLQSEKIMLSSDDSKLEIASAGAEVQIQAMSADEFPAIPTISSPQHLTLPRDIMVDALAEVVVAASLDESRPVLAGVFMQSKQDEIIFAATDSYRLAETRIPVGSKGDTAIIFPLRTVQEVLRLAGSSEASEVVLELGKTEAKITINNVELVTRLIEGSFPNYSQIIPSQATSTLRVLRSELVQAARLAGIFARESAHTITLKASGSTLQLHAEAAQVGQNTSEVSLKLDGAEAAISLNVRFLIDALSVISTDEVELRLNDKLDPCVVVPVDKKSHYIHLIMPLRS